MRHGGGRCVGVTQSVLNRSSCAAALFLIFWTALTVLAQTPPEEEFQVYTDHPRLLLTGQRLRLLKRERERQSMRWRQFEALVLGHAPFPEPGFALALYHAVTGDPETARSAIAWALAPGQEDVRQIALVYDWCQDALNDSQGKALQDRLRAAALHPAGDIAAERTRVLAAVADAEGFEDLGESVLRDVVHWWRNTYAPALLKGRTVLPPDTYAVLEVLHTVRDNTSIDLRGEAVDFFRELPAFDVAATYPAPYDSGGGEYHIPVYEGMGAPDLRRAVLARAGGLSLVAFDTNATENQYLQGWLMQDPFILRDPLGAPYEFLWANPYHPGLSYDHLPLTFYDPHSGVLFLRANWEDDSAWFGLFGSEPQFAKGGKITVIDRDGTQQPIEIGDALLVGGKMGSKMTVSCAELFVVNLKKRTPFDVEIDHEEMSEVWTDAAGTLGIRLPGKGEPTGVRWKQR